MDIVTLGELILDMFASETGKDFNSVAAFIPVAGGAPANVAVAAAQLGVKGRLHRKGRRRRVRPQAGGRPEGLRGGNPGHAL